MDDTVSTDLHIRFAAPTRVFGVLEPMDDPTSSNQSRVRRLLSRVSFSSSKPWSSRAKSLDSQKTAAMTERPPIPSMLRPSDEVCATPLPTLPMIVLSITMLGEFLCANVSTPFILFMVKGFGQFEDDAQIAFWAGILVSSFFLTQFLTSLLWATIAEKHGRRAVLIISLLGSAITCVAFGTCTSLEQAMTVRLMQGVFAGAVGVARGSVAFITDPSNEGRAYAILGFCWGLGGVGGAMVGGLLEGPAVKWPQIFGDIPIFVAYPYLLPCTVAAVITLTGSFLACFLGHDGGPREGAIRLPPEKDDLHPPIPEEESNPPSPSIPGSPKGPILIESIRSISSKLRTMSSCLPTRRVSALHATADQAPLSQPPVPLSLPTSHNLRALSRVSTMEGSAYGYSGNYRSRLASMSGSALRRRTSMGSSLGWRRGTFDSRRESVESQGLNFAQRLLMANENAVNNIADLWVAAAINVDNEDPFESDDDGENDEAIVDDDPSQDQRGRRTSRKQSMNAAAASAAAQRPSLASRPSRGRFSLSRASPRPGVIRQPSVAFSVGGTSMARRSTTPVPTIFSHPGVETPRAVLDAQELLHGLDEGPGLPDTLQPIMESRQLSDSSMSPDVEALVPKKPSLISQLPILVIIQYGVFALHTTTHDQVFMSYLVSDYSAGGLGLNATNFAQLIALMCLAQIAYQFYLYPNLGPPRGKFSHLAMFRLGSVLFIPAYLLVIPLRPFAAASGGNFVVASGLIGTTAARYCGSTFGNTAISILLNYMTPPHAVGYANGIAQSIVSLARCAGPALGGYLWSVGVRDDPSGYPFAFFVCAAVCAVCVLQSFMIR